MAYNENTKLLDILKDHPALAEKVAALDPRLAMVKSPLAKMMLRGKTVKDASDFSGIPAAELLKELDKRIQSL